MENKTSKYLKYAIGEIVLVVIGILIALQINTWNTNRLNRQKETFYLNRITHELKDDIKYYKGLRDKFNNRAIGIDRIIKIWQPAQPTILDTVQYLKDYTYAAGEDPWYVEPVTWTQLLQTGNLDLIRDRELTDELFIYYRNVKKVADNYLLNPNTVFTKARAISNLPLANYGGSYTIYQFIAQKEDNYQVLAYSDSKAIISVKNVIDSIWERRNELLPIFVQSSSACKFQKDNFQNIIDFGEQVLKKLEDAQGNAKENESL